MVRRIEDNICENYCNTAEEIENHISTLWAGKKILAKIISIAYMKDITLPNTSILKKVLNLSALPRYGTSKLVRHLILGNIQNTLTDHCINESLSSFFFLVVINNSFIMKY